MNPIFTKNLTITPSLCDASAALGYTQTLALFQDIASQHADEIGVGSDVMAARHAFWLTVHTRVRILQRVPMLQDVTAVTWPGAHKARDFRCYRYYQLQSGDQTVAEGKTEWAIIDTQTGRLRAVADAGFPEDFPFAEDVVCPEPLTRFTDTLTDADCVYTHIIRASDTDYGGHMNNIAYVRAILDAFTSAELASLPIREFEIHYASQSFEDEALMICRRTEGNRILLAAKKENGRAAALAQLVLGE